MAQQATWNSLHLIVGRRKSRSTPISPIDSWQTLAIISLTRSSDKSGSATLSSSNVISPESLVLMAMNASLTSV